MGIDIVSTHIIYLPHHFKLCADAHDRRTAIVRLAQPYIHLVAALLSTAADATQV